MTEEKSSLAVLKEKVQYEIGISKIDLSLKPVRISEILDEIAPQGEKLKLEQLEGKTIIFHSIRPFEGQYGVGLFCIITDEDGVLYHTVIGSKVIVPKLIVASGNLPLEGKVVRKEGGQYGYYFDIE